MSTGYMTPFALRAAKELEDEGIDVDALHYPYVKPFDKESLIESVGRTGRVVTVENQSIIEGLGGAVCEILSEYLPTPVKRLGVPDRFGEVATGEYLLNKHAFGVRAYQVCLPGGNRREAVRIVVGSVMKGFALKTAVKEHLEERGHEVIDVGCYDTSVFIKFPSIAERAARSLQSKEADFGILCCGSGTGMALAAGKFRSICAISCESPLAAEFGRKVNDANVLCMGESIVTPDVASRIVDAFLNTEFQDAPAISEEVRDFWAEARNEISSRGADATTREIETLK